MNHNGVKKSVQEVFGLGIILACAFCVRFYWVSARGFGIFNSDQAVIGLMAKHILEGKPMVYFYGQGYMGSLEAFTAAVLFKFFGMTLPALQCAPLLFYFGFLIVNFYLLKKVFGFGVSFTANLLLAVSPPALSVLSMTSLGGYPETLFFGSLVLYGWIQYEFSRSKTVLFWTGIAAGVGFWVNNLILMYFFAGALYSLFKSGFWEKRGSKKGFLDFYFFKIKGVPVFLRVLVTAVHLGMTVFLLWHTVSFFIGPKAFSVLGHTVTPASPIFHVKKMKGIIAVLCIEGAVAFFFQEGLNLCLKGLKSVVPFAAGFLLGGSPSFLYTLIGGEGYRVIHGAGMVYFRELPAQFNEVILDGFLETILAVSKEALQRGPFGGGLAAWLILFFSFSIITGFPKCFSGEVKKFLKLKPFQYSYAVYPVILLAVNVTICLFCNLKSGRYLMPVYFSTTLLFALGASGIYSKNKGLAYFLVLGLALSYGYANVLSVKETPDRAAFTADYHDAFKKLEEKGIRGGFADYWLSYEMTFLSQEKLILAPYHSEDRYPAYTRFAGGLDDAVYFFFKNRHEDAAFEKNLIDSGIPYQKETLREILFFTVRHRGAL